MLVFFKNKEKISMLSLTWAWIPVSGTKWEIQMKTMPISSLAFSNSLPLIPSLSLFFFLIFLKLLVTHFLSYFLKNSLGISYLVDIFFGLFHVYSVPTYIWDFFSLVVVFQSSSVFFFKNNFGSSYFWDISNKIGSCRWYCYCYLFVHHVNKTEKLGIKLKIYIYLYIEYYLYIYIYIYIFIYFYLYSYAYLNSLTGHWHDN